MTLPSRYGGRFELIEEIARRRGSVVYLADDTQRGVQCALKIFTSKPEGGSWAARYAAEVRELQTVSHPGLIPILGGGSENGWLYLVLEATSGTSLRNVIKQRGKVEIRTAFTVAQHIAEALEALHHAGLVHGHLDSRAILFCRGRTCIAGFVPPVIDVISKVAEAKAERLVVQSAYSAPELLDGDPLDQRADVFSFSALLYEMLSGKRPFSGRSALETAMLRLDKNLAPPFEPDPELPQQLSQAIAKGLSADKSQRFPDIRSCLDACRNAWEAERSPVGSSAPSEQEPVEDTMLNELSSDLVRRMLERHESET